MNRLADVRLEPVPEMSLLHSSDGGGLGVATNTPAVADSTNKQHSSSPTKLEGETPFESLSSKSTASPKSETKANAVATSYFYAWGLNAEFKSVDLGVDLEKIEILRNENPDVQLPHHIKTADQLTLNDRLDLARRFKLADEQVDAAGLVWSPSDDCHVLSVGVETTAAGDQMNAENAARSSGSGSSSALDVNPFDSASGGLLPPLPNHADDSLDALCEGELPGGFRDIASDGLSLGTDTPPDSPPRKRARMEDDASDAAVPNPATVYFVQVKYLQKQLMKDFDAPSWKLVGLVEEFGDNNIEELACPPPLQSFKSKHWDAKTETEEPERYIPFRVGGPPLPANSTIARTRVSYRTCVGVTQWTCPDANLNRMDIYRINDMGREFCAVYFFEKKYLQHETLNTADLIGQLSGSFPPLRHVSQAFYSWATNGAEVLAGVKLVQKSTHPNEETPYERHPKILLDRANPDLLLQAIEVDGALLELANPGQRDDEDLVLSAVKTRTSALRWASDRLRSDADFVQKVVGLQSRGGALKHAADEPRDNASVALTALKNTLAIGLVVRAISARLRDDCDFMEQVCGFAGMVLQVLESDARPRDNEKVALAAIRQQPSSFAWVSGRLQDSRDFILEVASEEAIHHVNTRFYDDEEIVLTALKRFPAIYDRVSPRLQHDRAFTLKAVKVNPLVFWELYDDTSAFLDDREVQSAAGAVQQRDGGFTLQGKSRPRTRFASRYGG